MLRHFQGQWRGHILKLKMINIDLKFDVNEKRDTENVLKYIGSCSNGIDYGKTIVSLHPELDSCRREECVDYIDNYYTKNSKKIENDLSKTEWLWLKFKTQFESYLNSIFPENFNFEEVIHVNPSAINSNPIFFEEKTFMYGINLNEKQKLLVIFHELIHFVYKRFLENFNLDKELESIMLESFNLVILNQGFFTKILSPEEERSYPRIRKNKLKLEKLYSESENLFDFSEKLKRLGCLSNI